MQDFEGRTALMTGAATKEAVGAVDVLCLDAGVSSGNGPLESLTTKD